MRQIFLLNFCALGEATRTDLSLPSVVWGSGHYKGIIMIKPEMKNRREVIFKTRQRLMDFANAAKLDVTREEPKYIEFNFKLGEWDLFYNARLDDEGWHFGRFASKGVEE